MTGDAAHRWQVWTDTGGTFTDCLALDPEGRLHRAKVLSSSALRCRVAAVEEGRLRVHARWHLVDGFAAGAEIHWLERDAPTLEIAGSRGDELEVTAPLPPTLAPPEALEIRFAEEAPVLAARLVTATPADGRLPPMAMRLATTRGTNALLEGRGARTAFFITRGFADLLRIGTQQRPELFALDVRRPPVLYREVVEVPERLAADGSVLEPLDLGALSADIDRLLAAGYETAAVALLHSYRNPVHEERLAAELRRRGFRSVSASAALAPLVKILPRAETAVVNAYLSPIIEDYLGRVAGTLEPGEPGPEGAAAASTLHVMTSAGGLVRAERYQAKDSLLSGPAGGVVGAVETGRELGRSVATVSRLIAFDMGGTSTDASRFDGDYEYLFEHRVGNATVAAPALAIETVAAGGGSICWHQGRQIKVGPESAGADPGPAAYGAGGPLTLTDVNLLLGRLDPSRFGIPIVRAAAEAAFAELEEALRAAGSTAGREALLQGFLDVANERMADAVRRISVRRGYDPRDYALVAFGGAGGQHAGAVAELLGIGKILVPREAGLLSALGLGAAVIERFAQRQVLRPLAEIAGPELAGSGLPAMLGELERRAVDEVAAEGVVREVIEVRRRIAFLRFAGQETALEVAVEKRPPEALEAALAGAFKARYEALYGYRPTARPIEVESLRVVASSRPPEAPPDAGTPDPGAPVRRAAVPTGRQRAFFAGAWREVMVYAGPDLAPGDGLAGPALVLDDYSTLVVEVGWRAEVATNGTIVVRR